MTQTGDLIATCTHLLIRFLLSGKYGNLFNNFIIFMYHKYAYLHIPIVKYHPFYILFGKIYLISGRLCHIGWPWPIGFSLHLLKLYCFFANARVFVLLYMWMTSLSLFTLCMWTRGHNFFMLYWFTLGYTFTVRTSSHSALLFLTLF